MSKQSIATPWGEGRVLHFVRHGHYDSGESGTGSLTALGRKQARCLARHFQGLEIAQLVSSDWKRARETASILAEALGLDAPKQRRVLREVLPTAVPGLKVPREKRALGVKNIELIMSRFFKPSRRMRHEIFVSHGNLIRALVMRVTAERLTGWHRLAVGHCGVTSFLITMERTDVIGVNVMAHLPLNWHSHV